MHFAFLGNHPDKHAAEDAARDAGLDLPAHARTGFVNCGREPAETFPRAAVAGVVEHARRLVDAGATRLVVDWEPRGEPWTGRSAPVRRATAERFATVVAACRTLTADVGVYGLPGHWLHFPHLTDTALDALDAVDGAGPGAGDVETANNDGALGAFYPELYLRHHVSETLAYRDGGIDAGDHATRVAAVLTATRRVAGTRPVRPCFMAHIENKPSPVHGERLTADDTRWWFRVAAAMGVNGIVWWCDNNDLLADVRALAPVIRETLDTAAVLVGSGRGGER